MLKRDGRLFLRGLIPATVLTALLLVACGLAGISAIKGAERESAPVKVALVDQEDSVLSRISITMVTGQDYVSSLMRVEVVDDDTARKGLASGKFAAAVILPENYMSSIMHGAPCLGKIYISDAIKSNEEVIRAIADFGQRLLTAGQYGVFAGEQILAEDAQAAAAMAAQAADENAAGGEVPVPVMPDNYDSFIEGSNTGLINFVLDAYNSVFTFEVLPYSDTGVSREYYYAACWITLLLFVCGLFFPELYIADCKGSLYARLRTRSIGRMHFLTGKLLYPFLFRLVISLPLLAVLDARAFLYVILADFFVTIITACISVSLAKRGGWVVLILGLSAMFLFMAGGMIPRTMLPEILPRIAAWTPFGAVQSLIIGAFGGSAGVRSYILCILYAALTFALCLRFLRTLDTHNEEVRL